MFSDASAVEASAFTVLMVSLRTCSKSVCCTSTVPISPGPLSPATATYAAIEIPENTEDNQDNAQPADEGNTIWDTLWISFTAQVKDQLQTICSILSIPYIIDY
jgi:hypothetical protein